MKKNKKMNIALVIVAIILSVVMFYVLHWAIFSNIVGSLMHAGSVVLILFGILIIATLCFSAILIVSIFKCPSLASVFTVWGITIFFYSLYPVSLVIENANKNTLADLESKFYRKVKDRSTSWEEFKSVLDEIEHKATAQYSTLSWFIYNNKEQIIYDLLYHRRYNFIDKMIESGHDITTCNMASYLHLAYRLDESNKDSIAICNIDQIKFLLSRGCDINATCSLVGNSLAIALWNKDEQCAQYLLDNGIDLNTSDEEPSSLSIAAGTNNLSMVKQLLSKGLDVKSSESLLYCIQSANKDIIELLLDNGADVNAIDSKGETVLMNAIRSDKDIIELLLDNGADVNAIDSSGKTVLMNAAWSKAEVFELLLQRGADPNILDHRGYDVLSIIARGSGVGGNEQRTKEKLLIKAGANLDRIYPNGETLDQIRANR